MLFWNVNKTQLRNDCFFSQQTESKSTELSLMSEKTFSLSYPRGFFSFCLSGLAHSSSHAAGEAPWLRGKNVLTNTWLSPDDSDPMCPEIPVGDVGHQKHVFPLSRQVILRIKAEDVLHFGRFTIFIVTTALAVINAKWRRDAGAMLEKANP